jgi:hypothetical protein
MERSKRSTEQKNANCADNSYRSIGTLTPKKTVPLTVCFGSVRSSFFPIGNDCNDTDKQPTVCRTVRRDRDQHQCSAVAVRCGPRNCRAIRKVRTASPRNASEGFQNADFCTGCRFRFALTERPPSPHPSIGQGGLSFDDRRGGGLHHRSQSVRPQTRYDEALASPARGCWVFASRAGCVS